MNQTGQLRYLLNVFEEFYLVSRKTQVAKIYEFIPNILNLSYFVLLQM